MKKISDHYEWYPKLKCCFRFLVSDLTEFRIRSFGWNWAVCYCNAPLANSNTRANLIPVQMQKWYFISVATGRKKQMIRSICRCVCVRLFVSISVVMWRVCVERMHFKVNVHQDTSFAVLALLIHQHETCYCNFHANRMVFFVASCFRVRFGALCLRLASLKGTHFDGSSFLFFSYAMNNSVPVQCASALKHPL